MQKWVIRFSTILLLAITACEKESTRIDDYLVDFATVLINGNSMQFQLDNQRILIPEKLGDYTGKNGQRIILNYTLVGGNTIKINKIENVFTGKVQSEGFPSKLVKDPVKIQSVWVGGSYLNMIVEIEYHSKAHHIALFRDPSSSTPDLYFSHSREDDSPGYPQILYASFSLDELRNGQNITAFNLFVTTYDEVRFFQLEVN